MNNIKKNHTLFTNTNFESKIKKNYRKKFNVYQKKNSKKLSLYPMEKLFAIVLKILSAEMIGVDVSIEVEVVAAAVVLTLGTN